VKTLCNRSNILITPQADVSPQETQVLEMLFPGDKLLL